MSKNAVLEFSLFGGAKNIEPDDQIITFQRGAWKKQSPFIYHPQYKGKITYREDLEENLDKKLTKTTYEMKKQEKGRISHTKLASTPNLHSSSATKEKEDPTQKIDTQNVILPFSLGFGALFDDRFQQERKNGFVE